MIRAPVRSTAFFLREHHRIARPLWEWLSLFNSFSVLPLRGRVGTLAAQFFAPTDRDCTLSGTSKFGPFALEPDFCLFSSLLTNVVIVQRRRKTVADVCA
jgi:hypothetical protein